MNYKFEIFLDNVRNFFSKIGNKSKNINKKKAAVIGGYILLIVIIILLFILLFKTGFSQNSQNQTGNIQFYSESKVKNSGNALKLAKKYADKGEYDRALGILEQILMENPDDEKCRDLLDKILEMKQNSDFSRTDSFSLDTSGLEGAVQSALDRQAQENQKTLERAFAEQSRQNAENQKALQENSKAMAELMEKQAAQEEANRIAMNERLEQERLKEEQRRQEEEKRRKAEEELAKKNAKLKSEIDAVNEQIKLGKASLAAGNAEEALEFFNHARDILPVSEGEPAFSASKNSEMAQALFDSAEKEGVSDAEKSSLVKRAVELAQSAIDSNPKDAAAHNILGSDALANKDYNKALEEFKKACLYDSNNYIYFYNLGKSQYVLKKYSEAVQSFTSACKLNASFSQSRYNLGLAYLKLKNDTQALDSFRKAIDLNPRYEKAYLEQARLLSKRGDYDGAASSYKKVIEINNVNTTALMEMGSAYYSCGKYSLSEESYLRALSLMTPSANYTLTAFNLSTVLFDEKKYTDAVSYAKKAYSGINTIKDVKSQANIIYNYALMLEKTGDLDNAITVYSEVLKTDPNHNKTRINLGVMYMDFDPPEAERARDLFQAVYDSDNSNFEANNNLGSAYLALEDYKNAIKHFLIALKLDSKNNDVRYNLAKAYTKDEDYATAKTVYLDLLKMDNQKWDAYLELSKICIQLGDNENAEKYLIYLQTKKSDFKKSEVDALLQSITG